MLLYVHCRLCNKLSSSSARQERSHNSRRPEVHCRCSNNTGPYSNSMTPIHTLKFHLCIDSCTITLLVFGFKMLYNIPDILCITFQSHISHFITTKIFSDNKNVGFITWFSPVSCYFLCLRLKYCPLHPAFKHLTSDTYWFRCEESAYYRALW